MGIRFRAQIIALLSLASPSVWALDAPEIMGREVSTLAPAMVRFKGKMTVVTFNQTACEFCALNTRALSELQKRFPDLQVISLFTRDSEGDIRKYMNKNSTPSRNSRSLQITEDEWRAYKVVGTPTSFLINEKGEIVYRYHSDMVMTPEHRIKVESLLRQSQNSVAGDRRVSDRNLGKSSPDAAMGSGAAGAATSGSALR